MRRHVAQRILTPVILGLVLLCALSPALAAFKVPQHQGYVTDLAGVMSPEAEQFAANIAQELDTKTQAQIAVLTIPRDQLGDIPVEDASLQTARTWGIGSKKAGNTGLLIFMAVSDKAGQSKLRTEIGYGLEGIITDGTSGEVQDQYMIPAFRQGNLDAGIVNGVAAYASLIARDKGVQLNSLSGEAAPQPQGSQPAEDTEGWLGSALVMFIIMAIIAIAFVSLLGKMFHSPYSNRGRYGSRVNDDGGLLPLLFLLGSMGGHHRGGGGGGFGGGGFGGFGGGGFGGGGSSRNW